MHEKRQVRAKRKRWTGCFCHTYPWGGLAAHLLGLDKPPAERKSEENKTHNDYVLTEKQMYDQNTRRKQECNNYDWTATRKQVCPFTCSRGAIYSLWTSDPGCRNRAYRNPPWCWNRTSPSIYPFCPACFCCLATQCVLWLGFLCVVRDAGDRLSTQRITNCLKFTLRSSLPADVDVSTFTVCRMVSTDQGASVTSLRVRLW